MTTKPTKKGRVGLRPRTINSHFAALRALGRWLCDTKRAKTNPAADVTTPRLDESQQAILSEGEVNALLDACDRLYPHRYRLLATAVMSVFLCTGLRKEDVRGLRLRNVHFGPSQEDNYLVAEHSKGDKEFRAS